MAGNRTNNHETARWHKRLWIPYMEWQMQNFAKQSSDSSKNVWQTISHFSAKSYLVNFRTNWKSHLLLLQNWIQAKRFTTYILPVLPWKSPQFRENPKTCEIRHKHEDQELYNIVMTVQQNSENHVTRKEPFADSISQDHPHPTIIFHIKTLRRCWKRLRTLSKRKVVVSM